VAAAAAAVVAIVVTQYPTIRIIAHDASETSSGYTLFCPTVDDLGFEPDKSTIYLIDMDGDIAHRWTVLGAAQLARLGPDGTLFYSTRDLSFKERAGVREIDPWGNVLWFYRVWVDHDFELLEGGNLLIHYVEDVEAPSVGRGVMRNPRIVEVTREKEVVWEWRGEDHAAELDALVGVNFPLITEGEQPFDWAHSNTASVIGDNPAGETDPRFRAGNILISYPNLNTIGVVDRDAGEIVWAWGPGVLDGQHDPVMTDQGRLMVFDNGTARGYSRVLELDPITEDIVWEYQDRDRFFSKYVSGAQPLPGGNVFVCQGDGSGRPSDWVYSKACRLAGTKAVVSRLFEVNRGGEVVWDCLFASRGETMHEVYQAVRYAPPDVRPLLEQLDAGDDSTRRLESLPYVR
jgi:hypothetical protein